MTGLLYAGIERRRILNIGKSEACSVRQRRRATDKLEMLERIAAVDPMWMVASIELDYGEVLTAELLDDLETMLILAHRPVGNIRSSRTRGAWRRGLLVRNEGPWPDHRRLLDVGQRGVRVVDGIRMPSARDCSAAKRLVSVYWRDRSWATAVVRKIVTGMNRRASASRQRPRPSRTVVVG